MSTSTISVDEFQALEQKVLRAVEIVKQEREARMLVSDLLEIGMQQRKAYEEAARKAAAAKQAAQ